MYARNKQQSTIRRPSALSLLAGLCLALSATTASAQLEFSISPSPIGSGARAAGMAGAFIAIADDATAASWNPAGLVQLERPEISIVGQFNSVIDVFRANFHPEFDSTHNDETLNLNYLSFVYPLPAIFGGRNASVSISYQRKFEFGRNLEIDFNQGSATSLGTAVSQFMDFGFDQEGGLAAISPAFAMEITQTLSIGVALNIWRSTPLSENGWTQKTRSSVTSFGIQPVTSTRITKEEYSDFSGENVTVGLLWNATDKLNLALRYDSGFTGTVDYKKRSTSGQLSFASKGIGAPIIVTDEFLKEQRKVRFPDSWAIGAAYRFNDRFTLSLSVTRTDWNDFYVQEGSGKKVSLVDGTDLRDPRTKTNFDPTYTVRLGAEYLFIPEDIGEDLPRLWSLRGGVFYDEEPASGRSTRSPTSKGTGEPDRFYGITFGTGLLYKQRFNFDFAYQLRYGPGVNSDFIRGAPGFEEDVFQQRVLFSTVIYF